MTPIVAAPEEKAGTSLEASPYPVEPPITRTLFALSILF